MLAQRKDIDFLDHDHVFAVFIEDSIADHFANRLFVTFGEEHQRLHNTKHIRRSPRFKTVSSTYLRSTFRRLEKT